MDGDHPLVLEDLTGEDVERIHASQLDVLRSTGHHPSEVDGKTLAGVVVADPHQYGALAQRVAPESVRVIDQIREPHSPPIAVPARRDHTTPHGHEHLSPRIHRKDVDRVGIHQRLQRRVQIEQSLE